MKKVLIFGIIILFISPTVAPFSTKKINLNENIELINEIDTQRGTHTVLGEFGTATWCGYCKYAHGGIKELYDEGQLDFYYVSHVCDKNSISNTHCEDDYNLYGFPTLWWDGGYKVDVGAASIPGAKSKYNKSINSCLARSVEDVEIDLTVTWLGGTEMQIDCTVINNEVETYSGTIRVFICEKVSSMGWKDTGGQLYTMPFLDWAFNEPISIPGGGSWSDSITWDGESHGYPSITKYNLILIGAVFNDEWHQGYSYPPSGNPFDAYYVNECVAVDFVTGDPPGKPVIDGPIFGVVRVLYEYFIIAVDPDEDDVYYNVDWGDGTSSGWIGPYPSGTNVSINNSWFYPGSYEVKVQAKDLWGLESEWSDSLYVVIENNEPSDPVIRGATSGKPGTEYRYSFKSIDPNGDDIKYFIDWGEYIVEWTDFYESGFEVGVTHIWNDWGIYTIRAKAKDTYGAESNYSELTVRISRSKTMVNSLTLWFLERCPLLERLIYIFGWNIV